MPTPTPEPAPPAPRLGQGTWHIGEKGADHAAEADALRLGIDLGLTLIDTAEMYAEGGAEQVVARAIAGRRDQVTLVSKAYPHNAGRTSLPAACDRSLRRLGTDRIDLYLLHWRGSTPLAETVEAFQSLQQAGKIDAWGVSNFDLDDMHELPPGCAANQVLYNLDARGIEWDLLPFCRQNHIPLMAYSPLGQGPHSATRLLRSKALAEVAARHEATPAQIALAWSLQPGVISIPKSATEAHVRQNAAARALHLTPEDHATLDTAHPPPRRKHPLGML